MWRLFIAGCIVLFGLGALAGGTLLVFLLADGEFKPAGGVALGTAVFVWMTVAGRREWQRIRQEREFRASIARERRGPP